VGRAVAASNRPSLTRPSGFAIAWNLSVWAGLALVGWALLQTLQAVLDVPPMDVRAFWGLAALVILGELWPVITAGSADPYGVVTSHAFVFAVLYVYGPWPALSLLAIGTLIAELRRRKEWWKVLFNIGQYSLSLGAAAVVMELAGWHPSLTDPAFINTSCIPWIALGWLAFFLVNDALVASLAEDVGRTFVQDFFDEFWFYCLTTLAVLSLAPLVVFSAAYPLFLPLWTVPLVAVRKTASISREKEHASLHDSLTQLANRKLLLSRLDQTLEDARLVKQHVALCLLDLDRFKEVNDTLGHHVGDRLLQLAASRIQGAVRPGDTVARLGGDEFALLLATVRDEHAAVEVANRVRSALMAPFHLEGLLFELEASIGIGLFPQHGMDGEQLLQKADVAMYVAKEHRTGVEVYSPDRDPNSANRLALLGSLRTALEGGELELHYQPKLCMRSSDVVGVEALVRWRHPVRGLVMPDEFIPIAEHSGLMGALTAYVVESALAQLAEWRNVKLDLTMAVNVTMRDLQGPELHKTVVRCLEAYDLPAAALVLEITERVLAQDSTMVISTLSELRALGVRISLDDFGTGESSLMWLKHLPVDELKIDRSFVARMATDAADLTIVRSVVELSHGLGMIAVAEGVEDERVWDQLCALGCDMAQGWYVSRPLSGPDVTRWLLRHPSRQGALRLLQESAGA
jgi:diguanylate cyclase (GGDEF)-like protein